MKLYSSLSKFHFTKEAENENENEDRDKGTGPNTHLKGLTLAKSQSLSLWHFSHSKELTDFEDSFALGGNWNCHFPELNDSNQKYFVKIIYVIFASFHSFTCNSRTGIRHLECDLNSLQSIPTYFIVKFYDKNPLRRCWGSLGYFTSYRKIVKALLRKVQCDRGVRKIPLEWTKFAQIVTK